MKSEYMDRIEKAYLSSPARGTWVEISSIPISFACARVVSRTGDVG